VLQDRFDGPDVLGVAEGWDVSVLRPGGLLVTAVARTDAVLAARARAAGRASPGSRWSPTAPRWGSWPASSTPGSCGPTSSTLPLGDARRAHEALGIGMRGKAVLTV
jgi:hypothetical protein